MKISRGINPVIRAISVIGAVVIIAGGVTYAATAGSVSMNDSNFKIGAVEGLKVWDGSEFSTSTYGITDMDMRPNQYTDDTFLYFENGNSYDIMLKIKANVEGATFTGLATSYNTFVKIVGTQSTSCAPTEIRLQDLRYGASVLLTNCGVIGAHHQADKDSEAGEGIFKIATKIVTAEDGSQTPEDLENNAGVENLNLTFEATHSIW